MIKLCDFLPKYPQINKTELDFYRGNFNQDIYNKKEFYENKLGETPIFPDVKGTYMKHQNIIARFLSSHTPYMGAMIFHEMGTGKSCATIATTELLLKNSNAFNKVLYLAPSETLIENFQNELINKCTAGIYNKKNLKSLYTFDTYEKFTTKITKGIIKPERYSHYIFVLDEVHHISASTHNYEHIKNFLHQVKESKTILLSGTPMVNNSKEFLEMMNFILPGQEIDVEKRSISNPQDIEYFKDIFRGKISYLKAKSDSDIDREFMGTKLDGFEEFKLSQSKMSKLQSSVYQKIFKIDKDKTSFYLDEIQASLFVFPDGSYGKKGFNSYIKSKKGKKRINKKNTVTWTLKCPKITKDKIKEFSSKYYQTIKIIQKAEKEGKIVFVYNSSVEQGGIILFSLLLKLFGYSRFTKYDMKGELQDSKRYILLTGQSSDKEIKGLIEQSNKSSNKRGDKIRVILGSNKVSEGFTFKNVQVVVIQTPHWNYSKLTQAIARSYRAGSHQDLQDQENLKVEIYQQVAIPESGIKDSIDVKMYKDSEIKDIEIKKMERLVKEIAFDCALNYDRNRITGIKDGSRECDYTDCNYTCDGILSNKNGSPLPPKEIDYSTYNLYYTDTKVKSLQTKIVNLFQTNFKLKYKDIKTELNVVNDFVLLLALQNLINTNIEIYSKFGMKCYLREDKNVYYLVDNFLNFNNFLSNYYIKFPFVINSNIADEIKKLNSDQAIQIKNLCSLQDRKQIIKELYSFPPNIINIFIQQAFRANFLNIKTNQIFRDHIISITKDYIVNGLNFYLWSKKSTENVTLFDTKLKKWVKASEKQINETLYSISEDFEILQKNEYGLYGLKDYQSGKEVFKIRTLEKKNNKGKNISSFTSTALAYICAINLKFEAPEKFIKQTKDNSTLRKILSTNKEIKKIEGTEDKIRFLYWNSKKLFNQEKIKGIEKVKADTMRKKIISFLQSTEYKKLPLVQNQRIFDIYKFYSELEDM